MVSLPSVKEGSGELDMENYVQVKSIIVWTSMKGCLERKYVIFL